MAEPILQIKNVSKIFGGGLLSTSKPVVALDDYSLDIYDQPAKITTIAGESGSGKTTLVNLILGYIPPSDGQILYKGVDLNDMDLTQRLAYRREVQAVFQDPYEVYNPFYRVQHIFDMVARNFHLGGTKEERRDHIEEALNVVGLRGEEILEKYPHQLSGGQRQRVMVARAYMLKPRLIVADEPVSAVDASLRAMILDIMMKLRDEHHISFLYITHDLSTAYQIGDEMYVLFQGVTAEMGDTAQIIENPKHPYVQELINSIPAPDPEIKWETNIKLPSEEEMRMKYARGCRFYPRCPHGMDVCKQAQPPMYAVGDDHLAACYLYQNGKGQ
ncbi:MAG: ABC transporter ATP-binding protein [Anaerolineaceae bacterium]|nr:ABC transporter ATP-binding protein [Anaerolineaceae bacterium]